jgi:glycosyltransferase involved in cell wall biosynthesis
MTGQPELNRQLLNMFTISVIIPTYNRKHSLSRALDSVLCQTLRPSEIIVVDDGSTDHTATYLKDNYSQVKSITQSHAGVSAARNTGLYNAKSDWIAFLDDDDLWHQDKLKIQTGLIKENKEYLVIHANEIWIRNGTQLNQKQKHQKKGGYIFQDCLPLCVISPSSVMIHKKIFEDVGVFDESLPACEDYDLWLRICAKYKVLYTDNELVIKHGGHKDQLSKKHWGMDRFRITALAKIISQGRLTKTDLNLAIKTMHNKIHIYHNGAKKHGNRMAMTQFQHLLNAYPLKH